jgi:hypothetical protein
MIAITVVLSAVIIMLMILMMSSPDKSVYATLSVKAINDTILEIKNTGGDSLSKWSIRINVNGLDRNGGGLVDINGNDHWDKDEVLYLDNLDLKASMNLTIVSGQSLLLTLEIPGRPSISVVPLVTITPTPVPHFTLPTPPPAPAAGTLPDAGSAACADFLLQRPDRDLL